MKQKSLIILIIVLVISNVFCIIGWNKSTKNVSTYQNYYQATKNLLDELEDQYNWVDAVDSYDYYNAARKVRN